MAKPAKRQLAFATLDDVIAEIERLRDGGYTQTGNWSLEQMCFHLGRPIPQPLNAIPAESNPRPDPKLIERFQHYADHNAPMPGITAPPGTEPGDAVPAGIVDDLIARLRSVIAFDGPFVDLGPRGPIPVEVYKGFVRGHCAHHLSFLIPSEAERGVTHPTMHFTGVGDVIRSVEKLRRGYTQDGNWTLPQTCWHLDGDIKAALASTEDRHPTEAEQQHQDWLRGVLADGKLPDGIQTVPEAVPPADVPESAVDEYLADLHTLGAADRTHVCYGPFGPMPLAMFRDWVLVHAAHHLKNLRPTTFPCFPKS